MMLIKIYGMCMDSMISVENLEFEKRYEGGDAVPVTQCSHHLVPLSSLGISPKLTSNDESYVEIRSISLCDLCIQFILVGWHGYFS